MSILTYIASDVPLARIEADDWDALQILPFTKEQIYEDIYTQKSYCAYLECDFLDDEKAKRIIAYVKARLQETDELELWHIWLGGLIEDDAKETRPNLKGVRTRNAEEQDTWDDWKKNKVHTSHINAERLNFEMLQAFFNNALSQHCIVVRKR